MPVISLPQFEAFVKLDQMSTSVFFEPGQVKGKHIYMCLFTFRGYRYKVGFEQNATGDWQFISRSRDGKWRDYQEAFVKLINLRLRSLG